MSNLNDTLHRDALAVLRQTKPSDADQRHVDGAFDYNQRRKEATLRFGQIASQIWEKLENNEPVGG